MPRYAASLIRALDAVAAERPDLQLSLLTTPAGAEASLVERMPVRVVSFGRSFRGGPGRILTEQIAAAAQRADLLHFFDLTGPVLAPSRAFVATVHDVSVAHGYSRYRQAYKRRLYPWALRRARRVVAVSSFAREQAVERMGADRGRIDVVHSGPGLTPDHGEPPPPGRAKSPYLLFVGNLTVSKNLPFFIRAYDEADAPCSLTLVGRPGERYAEVLHAIAVSPNRDRIQVIHDASDEELDQLYRHAVALVLPSRYEGFAFTPLEAMARGCPVLASDLPAIREVSGAGALLLSPDDVSAWTDALRRIVADESLREELRSRGASTVDRYSWTTTARKVQDVFSRALREG